MPAATIRRFTQLIGAAPQFLTPSAGATTHVTATATAASQITASPGATATVTATVTAPRLITASAAATAAATSLGAFAQVGSLGAPVQTAAGAAVSGLAYGQTPTAGNLLVIWWSIEGVTTTPATPAGWTAQPGKNGNSLVQSKTFTKIAAGGDAVPAFGGIASGVQSVMLGEFSGNAPSATQDQNSGQSTGGLASPQTATMSVADAAPGELVIYVGSMVYSAGVTNTANVTVNGAAGNDTTNNATSTANHYVFGWAITTSNASADVVSLIFNATSLSGVSSTCNSFRLIPVPVKVTAASQITPVVQATATVTATLTVPQLIAAPVSSTATMTATVFTSIPAPFAASMAATSLMTCDLTAPFVPPPPERRQHVHAVYVRI